MKVAAASLSDLEEAARESFSRIEVRVCGRMPLSTTLLRMLLMLREDYDGDEETALHVRNFSTSCMHGFLGGGKFVIDKSQWDSHADEESDAQLSRL